MGGMCSLANDVESSTREADILHEQSPLHLLPCILPALVRVHAEKDAQAARQAAGLLFQQIGLRLPFET